MTGVETNSDPADTPRHGLFRGALGALEYQLASKEFNGTFTRPAQDKGVGFALLPFFPWMLTPTILIVVFLEPVSSALGTSGHDAIEFVVNAATVYPMYAMFSALFSLMLLAHFSPHFRIFHPPRPGYPGALTSWTARRLAIVHYARFLRRFVFPWEWYIGRP